MGAALKSGYNSHYVITNKKGFALTTEEPDMYNEVVVNQESQITPVFIYTMDVDALRPVATEWARSVMEQQHQQPNTPTSMGETATTSPAPVSAGGLW